MVNCGMRMGRPSPLQAAAWVDSQLASWCPLDGFYAMTADNEVYLILEGFLRDLNSHGVQNCETGRRCGFVAAQEEPLRTDQVALDSEGKMARISW